MAKRKYYNIANLLSVGAEYNLLLGKRSNGKSYQVKKLALEEAYNEGKKFVYLRRWQMDIKQSNVSDYFNDMPIKDITHDEYIGVTAYQGYIYFYNVDEDHDNKIIRGPLIGRYCALNEAERYKSQVFDGYDKIIYEEFITDNIYLDNEPRKLMQFVSTVFRNRKGRVFLVGNTLSRVCPYFKEWNLQGTLRQRPGTIEIYNYHVEGETIRVAVEYCANDNAGNSMFFGLSAKQIVTGEWEVDDLPHLPDEQEKYECIYRMLVEYQDFKFALNLLVDPAGSRIVFIYPHTGKTKVDRIITDRFDVNPMISSRLDPRRKCEQHISECFRFNKVCYSDNLTGTDFRHVVEHFRFMYNIGTI